MARTTVEDCYARGILCGRCVCPHTDAHALGNGLEEGQGRKKSPLDWLGHPHGPLPHVPPQELSLVSLLLHLGGS